MVFGMEPTIIAALEKSILDKIVKVDRKWKAVDGGTGRATLQVR
jgi:hypothetical protein